jgi:hypothetical protein
MPTRQLPYGAMLPDASRARRLAARTLRIMGASLARLARRLHRSEAMPAGEPVYEFYAQAGAPEGALYIDGKLVALLPGVSRL